jgi:TRAP-type C4-dicarboxylate transport system permease small subunit
MLRVLRHAAHALGGLLFLALFLVFIVQIAARFLWSQPLPWTDEAAVILYVWIILWCAALVVPEREHVAFDLIWNSVSPNARRLMKALGHLLVGGLAVVALPASWDYVQFMAREKSPVLDISFQWIFLPFVVLLIALVLRSVVGLVQAIRGKGLDTELRV